MGESVARPRESDEDLRRAPLLPTAGASTALTRLTDLAERLLSAESPTQVQVRLLRDGQAHAGDGDLEVALVAAGGEVVGTLCALSPQPRAWSAYDVALLEELAAAVVAQLELQALSARYQASRLRWDTAIDAAGIGSFDWDLDLDQLDVDDRMRALFGFEPDSPQQPVEVVFARIHPDDRPAVDAAVEAAVSSIGDLRTEYRVLRPDGAVRWVAGRGRALAGPTGRADRLVGTVHDVTQLRTARDDAARLLETMATGFIALDPTWHVTYVNAECADILGMSVDQLVGHLFWDAFPGSAESEFGRQYQHAAATGRPVEFEAYYEHLARWYEVRAVPSVAGLSLYFLDVTGRHADKERAEAATLRLELLASVSAELAAAGLDVEGAVARLSRVVVPVLGDWCIVSLTTEDGGLRDVGCWHADPELQPLVETYTAHRLEGRTDLGPIDQARRSFQPVCVDRGLTTAVLPTLGSPVARAALTVLAPEAAAVVPLLARGQLAGVLTLLRGAQRPPFDDAEVAVASEVGVRAGLALDSGRLYAEQRGLAEGLQRSLLTTPPQPEHCRIAVRYVPAAEVASVGGDWFDAFVQADGATVLVIGDVMGHDTAAAAAMGQLRGLLRGIAWHSGAAPAGVLAGLDAAMRGLAVDTTASAVVARLEQDPADARPGPSRLRWSNAGHPPPLLLTPDGTVVVLTGTEPDLLLGVDPDRPRTESSAALAEGSTVLLYTDGLIERRGQDLDEGLSLLRDTLTDLAGLEIEQLCDELLARLLPVAADDDVALVAVRLSA